MNIATWNINGIRARLDNLCTWLREAAPDICCLQEIKSEGHSFPRGEIEDLGYNLAIHGQKGFNGVAILSKLPIDEAIPGLPGDHSDEQARYLEAVISSDGGAIRIASLYLPNGNPVPGEKFDYKLGWMERLIDHARARLALEEVTILAGDYNVIPTRLDARDPDAWTDDALFQTPTLERWRRLIHLGYTDGVRACSPDGDIYSYWDYQAGAWQKNNGIRIDHLLLSPQAADRLKSAAIDKHVRGWEKPSDHVPVRVVLDI